jgi:pyridoxal biosynthesis lyase PdxS
MKYKAIICLLTKEDKMLFTKNIKDQFIAVPIKIFEKKVDFLKNLNKNTYNIISIDYVDDKEILSTHREFHICCQSYKKPKLVTFNEYGLTYSF